MTNYQINLIKTSWKAAAANADTIGPHFYNCLFQLAPTLKPMFSRTTLSEQSKKLLTMLSYVINKLDTLEDLMEEVTRLAQRHVQYGVEAKHYSHVGAALLLTLEEGLGEHWNDELEQAWLTCYGILSSAMINTSGYAQQDAA